MSLYQANGRGGFGSQTAAGPPLITPAEPLKSRPCVLWQHLTKCKPCKHVRALSIPALQRGAAWAEERLLGFLRQSVPQNGRVRLHSIDLGVSETGSAKTGSAIDVRIDDAGSILKFRIGVSPGFSAVASHLRPSLLVGFEGVEAVDTEFPHRALSSIGGRLPYPCLPSPFPILRRLSDPEKNSVETYSGRIPDALGLLQDLPSKSPRKISKKKGFLLATIQC